MATTLRVAAVQMECRVGERQDNLAKATKLIEQAVAQETQLVLLPELMPGGYLLTEMIWDTAEPFNGESVAWLKRMSQQHGIYLGTTFLEVEGEDFFNSFVLINPQGELIGRVRKSPPASVEAYFYRAGDDQHIIDTEIGRIGVAICYESLLYSHIKAFHDAGVDLVLQPASAPTPEAKFPLSEKDAYAFNEMLRDGPIHYAKTLGVPVVMANKVGELNTGMPGGMPEMNSRFPGFSSIVDSSAEVKAQMEGGNEGVIVESVRLDKQRKVTTAPPCFRKRWAVKVPWYAFIWRLTQWMGERDYIKNKCRRKKAKELSR